MKSISDRMQTVNTRQQAKETPYLEQTAQGQTVDGGVYESHIEVAGNFKTACQQLLSWIKDRNLLREQIVSITANETNAVDGDAILVLVFKRQQDPSMVTRLTNLQYHLTSSVNEWDFEYEEMKKNIIANRCDILSLTHTARNIGQVNIQVLWFLPATPTSPKSYTYKHIVSQKSQEDAIEQARLYLDEWVPPHRLVSVSAFEEDHPNHSNFNVVILVRGDIEKPVQPPVGRRDDSNFGKIYNLDVT